MASWPGGKPDGQINIIRNEMHDGILSHHARRIAPVPILPVRISERGVIPQFSVSPGRVTRTVKMSITGFACGIIKTLTGTACQRDSGCKLINSATSSHLGECDGRAIPNCGGPGGRCHQHAHIEEIHPPAMDGTISV